MPNDLTQPSAPAPPTKAKIMTENEGRLEACPNPWCEAEERDGDFSPQVRYSNFGLVFVACTSCGMAGPTCNHEAEAIAAWNQRSPTNPVDAVGAEGVEAAQELLAQAFERSGHADGAAAVRRGKVPGFGTPLWMDEALDAIRTALRAQPVEHDALAGEVINARLALANWQKYNGEKADETVYQAEKVAASLDRILAALSRQPVEPDGLAALIRFHETGGHEGDGSDEGLAKAKRELAALSRQPVKAEGWRALLQEARDVVSEAALHAEQRKEQQRADDLFVLREQMDEALSSTAQAGSEDADDAEQGEG